jgi:MFS family permease
VVLSGLALLGVGAALLGAFRNIPMAAASTFTIGMAIAFVWIPAQTMSQQETPPAMVGRVSSTFMSLISMSQVLGLILSGYLAQIVGIRSLFMVSASIVGLIAAGGYLWLRGRPDPTAIATG